MDSEGEVTGRIDLKFSQGFDENVYFSLECKRLRVRPHSRFDTLANKYVTQGMFRYFTGQYAKGLNKGGMLAYIMDGEVEAAIYDVTKSVEKNRIPLYMGSDDTLCISRLSSQQVRETYHNYGPDSRFMIYHIFLPAQLTKN